MLELAVEDLYLDEVLRAQHGLQSVDVPEPRSTDVDPFVSAGTVPRATVASSSCAAFHNTAVRSTVSHRSRPRRSATLSWREPSALSAVGRTNWGLIDTMSKKSHANTKIVDAGGVDGLLETLGHVGVEGATHEQGEKPIFLGGGD